MWQMEKAWQASCANGYRPQPITSLGLPANLCVFVGRDHRHDHQWIGERGLCGIADVSPVI